MINWHQNQLAYLKEQWLVDAAVRLNPKLKLSPKYQISAVHSITRLDLSSNDLSEVCTLSFQRFCDLFYKLYIINCASSVCPRSGSCTIKGVIKSGKNEKKLNTI